jgi:hypothetical protein
VGAAVLQDPPVPTTRRLRETVQNLRQHLRFFSRPQTGGLPRITRIHANFLGKGSPLINVATSVSEWRSLHTLVVTRKASVGLPLVGRPSRLSGAPRDGPATSAGPTQFRFPDDLSRLTEASHRSRQIQPDCPWESCDHRAPAPRRVVQTSADRCRAKKRNRARPHCGIKFRR